MGCPAAASSPFRRAPEARNAPLARAVLIGLSKANAMGRRIKKRKPNDYGDGTAAADRPGKRRASMHRRIEGTGERRGLDMGTLDKAIGFALRRAQISVFADYAEATRDLAVSTAQFAILCLVRANAGLSQGSLGQVLGIEGPRTAFIIDDLEKRGLLVRRPLPSDRRARAIFLTPLGRRLHEQVAKREAAHNAKMIERLRGEDRDALLRMLALLATPV